MPPPPAISEQFGGASCETRRIAHERSASSAQPRHATIAGIAAAPRTAIWTSAVAFDPELMMCRSIERTSINPDGTNVPGASPSSPAPRGGLGWASAISS